MAIINIFDAKTKEITGTIEADNELDAATKLIQRKQGGSVIVSEGTEFPGYRYQRGQGLQFWVDKRAIKAKRSRQTFTVILDSAEKKRERGEVSRYSPNSEKYEFRLDCRANLDDGTSIYFKSPKIVQNVASAPGCAVVTYNHHDNGWLEVQDNGNGFVATPGKPAGGIVVEKLKPGDKITVSGLVKADHVTSRKGNVYSVLTHIKLEKVHGQERVSV